jgi:phosphohistidine phosphatase SixA
MKIIFFRHATAHKKNSDENQMDDFKRDLTKEGVAEAKIMSQSLRFIFKNVHTIYSSPLLRALHTAEILHKYHSKTKMELMASLDPFVSPEKFIQEIKSLDPRQNYCFVGHEPHLSESINFLLNAKVTSQVAVAKGGVVVLEGDDFNHLQISSVLSPRMVNKIAF